MAQQKKKKKGPENKSSTRERIQLAAIGMEAEFAVIMDGIQVKPETFSEARAGSFARR